MSSPLDTQHAVDWKIPEEFAFSASLGYSWNVLQKNVGFFLQFGIAVALLIGIPTFAFSLLFEDIAILSLVSNIALWLWEAALTINIIHMLNELIAGKKARLQSLLKIDTPRTKKYVITAIHSMVIAALPLVLAAITFGIGMATSAIVPALRIPLFLATIASVAASMWMLFKYQFATTLTAEYDLPSAEALQTSSQIVRAHTTQVIAFGIGYFLINLLGLLLLGVGLIITIPLTMIAYFTLYKSLSRKTAHSKLS